MLKASIIIRTKDEERWIRHCLEMVRAQSLKDLEVILVDNESRDATVKLAQRHGIDKLTTVSEYRPGDALNKGIELSTGQYIVCLSAHCVPRDERWLERLLSGFESDAIAGVYGRQIPVAFSSDNDKRDLLITFGLDRRVQVRDYFFHNANSAIRRDIWGKYPFDGQTSNIEDRLWAMKVVAAGYHLVYEPEAAVYHHHGIHQNREVVRARNVVSILERMEPHGTVNSLPSTMLPENARIAAVCPVLGEIQHYRGDNLLESLVKALQASKYVSSIYLLSENLLVKQLADGLAVQFIARPGDLYPKHATVEDVLRFALHEMEERGDMPDGVLYANYLFPHRPSGFFDELVKELQYNGLDTVFGGLPDYDNYWVEDPHKGFQIIGDGMKPRATKRPLYRALYGLGSVIASAQIRKGTMIGERVGIVPIHDTECAYKVGATLAAAEPGA